MTRNGHADHDMNWTLRSLLAAGLLSVCAVATAYSATVSSRRAAAAADAEAALAEQASLVAEFARYLKDETVATRDALGAAPRLKPARDTAELIASNDLLSGLEDFDFTELTIAKLDSEERKCLTQAIYYESRSEPKVGQLAVADVVLNRVASPLYPNSICEVVFQGSDRRTGCQFSFTCDGAMQARVNKRKWKESDDLAGAVLAGIRAPVSRRATHYHASYVNPQWADQMTPTATIGTHKFYKFKSRTTVAAAPTAM